MAKFSFRKLITGAVAAINKANQQVDKGNVVQAKRVEPTPPNQAMERAKEYQRIYDQMRIENQRLRKENDDWSREFNLIIKIRENANRLEKSGNIEEALTEHFKAIEYGNNSPKLNILNFAFDIERVIILYGKLKQNENLKIFLEGNIRKYPNYRDTKDWRVRLSKLNSTHQVKSIPNRTFGIDSHKPGNPTIGKQIETLKRNMPEFNFYFDMPVGGDTLGYPNKIPIKQSKKLSEFREAFNTIKSIAMIAENEGNYKVAIEAYERMILEEFEGAEPYERLILIYSKLKWKEEEESTLKRAIVFFTELGDRQRNYVEFLSEKYGMLNKALEYINNGKKIFYYMGIFELYNPQTARINKWNARLSKSTLL